MNDKDFYVEHFLKKVNFEYSSIKFTNEIERKLLFPNLIIRRVDNQLNSRSIEKTYFQIYP